MDLKGITWAGNLYQKFEAMCLEVEEAMYQDTAKYVENQVQKVGVSVKKFYSEVMEDLLPPSCVYPMNLASGDLSLDTYGDTAIDKKAKPSVFDSHCNLKKKENEDQVNPNVAAEKKSSPIGYYDINSLSAQNKCSEPCAAISKKVGAQKRPVGIKRISKNNLPPKDSSRTSLSLGDRIRKRASSNMSGSSRVASDDINMMPSSDLDVSRGPGEAEKENASNPDRPIESPASEKILPAESVRQNEEDSDCVCPDSGKNLSAESVRQSKDDYHSISPGFENNLSAESERLKGDSDAASSCSGLLTESAGTSVKDVSSMLGTSVKNKSCNLESEDKLIMTSNEGASMKDGSSSVCSTSCNAVSWNKDIIVSTEESLDMEAIEKEEAAEPWLESFEREKLEESCVMVEGDNLIAHETRKHKSYKKKIRESISLKLRSRKDAQPISQHESVLSTVAEEKKLSAHDPCESDWELI